MKHREQLKKYRKDLGHTTQAMADKIGVSLSLYEKIERGARNPSYQFITKFKEAFPSADIAALFFALNGHEVCATGQAS